MRHQSQHRSILEIIDIIYSRGFNNYISPSKQESMIEKGYKFEEWKHGPSEKDTKLAIRCLLSIDRFVTSGYMASAVKNYHNRYIIWK